MKSVRFFPRSPKVRAEAENLAQLAKAAVEAGVPVAKIERGRAGAAELKAWKRQGRPRKPETGSGS